MNCNYIYTESVRSQSSDKSQIAIAMKCVHCKEPEDPESCWNKFNRATWIYLEVLNCAACISETDDAKLWTVASFPCDFVFVLQWYHPKFHLTFAVLLWCASAHPHLQNPAVHKAFEYLPVGAVIEDKILCLHGGAHQSPCAWCESHSCYVDVNRCCISELVTTDF